MSQEVTIQNLIVAAAEGAGAGIMELQAANIPVELDEFEIEVTYSATTDVTSMGSGKIGLSFKILRSTFGRRKTTRTTESYGLRVKFLFTGVKTEEES